VFVCTKRLSGKPFVCGWQFMMGNTIPNAVCAVVGDVLGSHYFNHTRLNTLFMESGAPGDPPEGNCVNKCTSWLKRCNTEGGIDPLGVLGAVLEEFMEIEPPDVWGVDEKLSSGRERVTKILSKYGLSYHVGGHVYGATSSPSSQDLRQILETRDLKAVNTEFERAIATIESDPPAAVTAACSLLESLCKIYIEDEELAPPSKETIKGLWKVVGGHLGFDPAALPDDDLRRILSGLSSVVDGVGSLRTHSGSAHGRGRTRYRLEPRHARLAVHAAHTLVFFVLETWEARCS
jgi:hypothetical protein